MKKIALAITAFPCGNASDVNLPYTYSVKKVFKKITTIFFLLFFLNKVLFAADYYVDNIAGNNSNNGTSASTPWFDFTNINSRTFVAGDRIFLKSGCVWNSELRLKGSGNSGSFITLDSYGSGNKPKIQRNSQAADRTVFMDNTSYWIVRNLEICNAGDGIRLVYTNKNYSSVYFDRLYIHNIDLIVNGSPSTPDGQYYSTGIFIQGTSTTKPASSADYIAQDIRITNSEIGFTTAPFTFLHRFTNPSGNNTESSLSFRNILVDNNYIHDHKGPVSVRDMNNSAITNNFCKTGATVSLPQGTTGFFNFNIDNVVFEGNQMDGIPNTGSADQCWIDNEAYCNNVRIFGNLIKNTAGPGVEFLALGNGANPPRGADDFNTNNLVEGNVFSNNGGGALAVGGSNVPAAPSGTASNNSYLSGNTFFNGTSSGFTLSNNTASSQSSSNIARFKAYIASSNWDNSQRASKACDGSASSNWQSASGTGFNGQWLRVNFAASTTFDRVILSEFGNRTSGFRIEYSNDGINWQTAYTGTTIGSSATFNFNPVSAKAARIYFTAGANTPIIYEFEVYNTSGGGNGTNYIQNPGFEVDNFDTQTPTSWSTWTSTGTNYDADYTQTINNPHGGLRHLAHWRNGAYDVYTYQFVTGLPNGTYTATVYAKTIGTPSQCFLKAQDFGGTALTTNISGSTYVKYTISNIQVTNGQCLVGVYTVGNQNNAALFDDFTLSNNNNPFVNRSSPVKPLQKDLTDGAGGNLNVLYPNPVKNSVRLSYKLPGKAIVNISVFTVEGKLVKSKSFVAAENGTGNFDLEVADLTNGNYIVKIICGKVTETKNMVIQK